MKTITARFFLLIVLNTLTFSAYSAGEYLGERNSFGRFHGQGVYTTSRGDIYDGHWLDGRKSGKGTYTWKNGDKYSGDWKKNKRHGAGKMNYANGDQFSGQWRANKPSGKGKMVYANGERYEGLWHAGLPSGKGTYYLGNGDKIVAVWRAGDVEKKSSIYEFADGMVFNGTLVKLKPHGVGRCIFGSEDKPCEYKRGKKILVKTVSERKVEPILKRSEVLKAVPVAVKVKPVVLLPPKKKKVPAPVIVKKIYASNTEELTFNHSWSNGGHFDGSVKLEGRVIDDDTGEEKTLKVISESESMKIRLKVENYKGVGEYSLKFYNARIAMKGKQGYASTEETPGKLRITRDTGKLISGVFSFKSFPYGNETAGSPQRVKNGQFTVEPVYE